METDIRQIDDMPPTQTQMRNLQDDDDEDNESIRQTPIYLPRQPPQMQQFPQFDKKTQDLFGEIDKTTYIIIFVAFILGFFMGKTMQPVILRPG